MNCSNIILNEKKIQTFVRNLSSKFLDVRLVWQFWFLMNAVYFLFIKLFSKIVNHGCMITITSSLNISGYNVSGHKTKLIKITNFKKYLLLFLTFLEFRFCPTITRFPFPSEGNYWEKNGEKETSVSSAFSVIFLTLHHLSPESLCFCSCYEHDLKRTLFGFLLFFTSLSPFCICFSWYCYLRVMRKSCAALWFLGKYKHYPLSHILSSVEECLCSCFWFFKISLFISSLLELRQSSSIWLTGTPKSM